jgi:phage-related protein
MRRRRSQGEKPLHWVGSSKRDLLEFPDRVVDNIGYALGVVQFGGHPPSAKPWKGLGPGVSEIVEDDASGTFRAVYTVRFREAIYVLHAFRKNRPPESGPRARISVDRTVQAARKDYENAMAKADHDRGR